MVDSYLNPLDTAPRVNPLREGVDKKPLQTESGNSNFKNILVEKFNQESAVVSDSRPVSPPVNSIQPSLFRTPSANKPQSHSSNNEPAATNSAVSDYTIADPSEAISSAVAVKEETLPPASTPAPQKPAQPANLAELLKKDMPEVLEATPEIKPERKIETTPVAKPVRSSTETATVQKPERKIVAPEQKPVEAVKEARATTPAPQLKKRSESKPVVSMDPPPTGKDSNKNFMYSVKPGDTLSHVITMALRDSGRSYSTSDIYHWVQVVARANGILNPNRIYNSQQVDLSPIYTGETKINTKPVNRITINPEIQAPINGRITSRFGMRDHPVLDKEGLHSGIDISAPIGSGVHPMLSGMIVFSAEMGGYGKMIEVDHGNGLRTRYGHLSESFTKVGEYVTTNQIIGLTGQTGLATGPHLHFEIRQGGQPIDPLTIIPEQLIESRSNAAEIS